MKSLLKGNEYVNREERIEEIKDFMLKGLSEPVGPGVIELLRYMRGPEAEYEESEKSFEHEEKSTFIFKLSWF